MYVWILKESNPVSRAGYIQIIEAHLLLLGSVCNIYIYVKTFTRRGIPKHWRLSWFRYETYITFLTFRFSTRGERDTIFTMLTVRPASALNSLIQQTRARATANNRTGLAELRKSTRPVYVQVSTNCFFSKSPRIPPHCFRAWRHSHPLSYFLSGVFIMTSVIVTSSVRKREHLPLMWAPTRALRRTVLSLTKPKDKI